MIDYNNFKLSLKNLEEQLQHYNSMDDSWPQWNKDGIAESVIQRFEVCYDCLWKVAKRHLEEETGLSDVPTGPKPLARLAHKHGLLQPSVEQWFQYIQMRIDTTHDYNGEKAQSALSSMAAFVEDAIMLYKNMTGEDWA